MHLRDHLHIRGEYYRLADERAGFMGSPPHTWRILLANKFSANLYRITSTYVENTMYAADATGTSGDHLHIRGEYLTMRLRYASSRGSPPHTWRILMAKSSANLSPGITSTYVENTMIQKPQSGERGDHLHIRGEYSKIVITQVGRLGSPPHTWRIQNG